MTQCQGNIPYAGQFGVPVTQNGHSSGGGGTGRNATDMGSFVTAFTLMIRKLPVPCT